jgi:hypothetical protein
MYLKRDGNKLTDSINGGRGSTRLFPNGQIVSLQLCARDSTRDPPARPSLAVIHHKGNRRRRARIGSETLSRAQAFMLAVVPPDQIRIDFCHGAKSRQFTCANSTSLGTSEYLDKCPVFQSFHRR